MAYRLEITTRSELPDPEGRSIRRKARDYFGIEIEDVRAVQVVTLDVDLTADQLERVRTELFTNPVTQVSSFAPLPTPFDFTLWIGYRPGVRDNPGATAMEAMADILQTAFPPDAAVYTSSRYCLTGRSLTADQVDRLAAELLANDIIQQWRIIGKDRWDPETGIGIILPKGDPQPHPDALDDSHRQRRDPPADQQIGRAHV